MSIKKNMHFATMLEWRKCLQVQLLMLYELADYTREGLLAFEQCYWDYMRGVMEEKPQIKELIERFKADTGIHMDEVTLKGTAVTKMIKTIDAYCIQVGAVILWEAGEWEKKDVRQFVYKCWDYLRDYGQHYPQIVEMSNETGVDIKLKGKRRKI